MAAETQNLESLETNLDASNTLRVKPSIEDLFDDSENFPNHSSSLEADGTDEPQKDGENSKAEDPAANSSADAPISDTQKKIRRAERFGLSVQLSEEEKRSSRAERFGTGPMSHGPDALQTSEENKRKSRAERFGLPVSANPADEEAKKKARLARFLPSPKTDPVEEEKRKAREVRFSEHTSTSVSKEEPEGNIEQVHVIAGKANGGV